MHRTPYLSLLSLVVVVTPLSAAEPAADFFLHKGERIVFLGDMECSPVSGPPEMGVK